MQASKHDLIQIGAFLGLHLSYRLTTEGLLRRISDEFIRLHQALAWLSPEVSSPQERLEVGCRARIEAMYELARKKKFGRVVPSKETP